MSDNLCTRWVTTAGDLSNLCLRTEEMPAPAAGEVQVSVRAVGFNFADLFACLGLYRYQDHILNLLC